MKYNSWKCWEWWWYWLSQAQAWLSNGWGPSSGCHRRIRSFNTTYWLLKRGQVSKLSEPRFPHLWFFFFGCIVIQLIFSSCTALWQLMYYQWTSEIAESCLPLWYPYIYSLCLCLYFCFANKFTYTIFWPSLVAQAVKNLPAMRETWVPSLGWKYPLEEGMTTHSSILARKTPWRATVHGITKSQTRLSN